MPAPSVEPMPRPSDESRADVPLDAHEASYLAASARMMSFCRVSTSGNVEPCRALEYCMKAQYSDGAARGAIALPATGSGRRSGRLDRQAELALEPAGGRVVARVDRVVLEERTPIGLHAARGQPFAQQAGVGELDVRGRAFERRDRVAAA